MMPRLSNMSASTERCITSFILMDLLASPFVRAMLMRRMLSLLRKGLLEKGLLERCEAEPYGLVSFVKGLNVARRSNCDDYLGKWHPSAMERSESKKSGKVGWKGRPTLNGLFVGALEGTVKGPQRVGSHRLLWDLVTCRKIRPNCARSEPWSGYQPVQPGAEDSAIV